MSNFTTEDTVDTEDQSRPDRPSVAPVSSVVYRS